jgi:hypothetical protein
MVLPACLLCRVLCSMMGVTTSNMLVLARYHIAVLSHAELAPGLVSQTEPPCLRQAKPLHCAHLRAIVAREASKGGVKTMRSVNADLVFAASCRAY